MTFQWNKLLLTCRVMLALMLRKPRNHQRKKHLQSDITTMLRYFFLTFLYLLLLIQSASLFKFCRTPHCSTYVCHARNIQLISFVFGFQDQIANVIKTSNEVLSQVLLKRKETGESPYTAFGNMVAVQLANMDPQDAKSKMFAISQCLYGQSET